MVADAGWKSSLTFVRAFHQSQASRRSRPSRFRTTTSSTRLSDLSRHVSNAVSTRARCRCWRTAAERSLRVRDCCARSCHRRKTRSRSSGIQKRLKSQSPLVRCLGTAHKSARRAWRTFELDGAMRVREDKTLFRSDSCRCPTSKSESAPTKTNRRQSQEHRAQLLFRPLKRLTSQPSRSTT